MGVTTVTSAHFSRFQSEFVRWAQHFGLDDWRIQFRLQKLDGKLAVCSTTWRGRVCSVSLTEEWDDQDGTFTIDNGLDITAKHEAIHLLLADFSAIASSRYISEDEAYAAEERLVRKFERLIPDPDSALHVFPRTSVHIGPLTLPRADGALVNYGEGEKP